MWSSRLICVSRGIEPLPDCSQDQAARARQGRPDRADVLGKYHFCRDASAQQVYVGIRLSLFLRCLSTGARRRIAVSALDPSESRGGSMTCGEV